MRVAATWASVNAQALKHLFRADPCFIFRNWVVALCILIQTEQRHYELFRRKLRIINVDSEVILFASSFDRVEARLFFE